MKQVESTETEAQVFKLMRWAKLKLAKQAPPLHVSSNQWLSDQLEPTIALRNSLLARFNARNNIETWEDGKIENIPWNRDVSLCDGNQVGDE